MSDEIVDIERINNVRNKIRQRINTHPNLVSVWDKYIDIRIKKLNQAISECEKLEERIDSGHEDLTLEQIYMLCAIYNRFGGNN